MVAPRKLGHLHRFDLEVVGHRNVVQAVERKRHRTSRPGGVQATTQRLDQTKSKKSRVGSAYDHQRRMDGEVHDGVQG